MTRPRITRDDMFEPLLEALPSFRPAHDAFIEYWTPKPGEYSDLQPGEYPNYILLGDLASHLADLLESGNIADVSKALKVAKRWMVEGEHYVRETAIVGLLEDLQNVAQRRKIDQDRFVSLLGPEGKISWDTLNGFWQLVSGAPKSSPPKT